MTTAPQPTTHPCLACGTRYALPALRRLARLDLTLPDAHTVQATYACVCALPNATVPVVERFAEELARVAFGIKDVRAVRIVRKTATQVVAADLETGAEERYMRRTGSKVGEAGWNQARIHHADRARVCGDERGKDAKDRDAKGSETR
jgi:hypothetical protein